MTRAAVGILQKDKRILVCQRKRNSRYELRWEFPGGKVEPGESPFECLKRELSEEISVAVEEFDRMETSVNGYSDGGVFEVTYYFVSRYLGTPVNNVFEEIRWVTLAELKKMDILEGNKSIVAGLDETIFR